MNERPVYSIVAPVYNEEDNVNPFYERVRKVMDALEESWELIMVNDGSRDDSLRLIEAIANDDPRVKIINFARNFGHQIAVTAGIDYASGRAIILIDTDLQDPPEVIPDLIAKWKEGYHVVYGVRTERQGETWFKKTTAKMFYRFVYRITEIDIPMDTGDFRLMDEKVAQVLRDMREHNRFIRGMTSWVGFKQVGVGYVRHARHAGQTKYPFRKMVSFALDAVTGFSYFPLRVMVYVSFVLGVLAIVAGVAVAVLRIVFGESLFGGQATTIVLLMLLSSFQLFFLFVMGQYIARIYDEVRERPLYIVASVEGFESDKPRPRQPQRAAPYVVASTVGFESSEQDK
jgi:dolichol-phosphate mannosyltransferase